MNGNKRDTATTWIDPDDAPELNDDFSSAQMNMSGKHSSSEVDR